MQQISIKAATMSILTLVMLNKDATPTFKCQPIRFLDPYFYINSHTEGQTMQIQISWLLQKPADLDLHCLQRQGISGFSRARINVFHKKCTPTCTF